MGSGAMESVPISMRATSSRSLINSRIRSACASMIWWNCPVSAELSVAEASSRVVIEPLTAARGVLSSWLTMAKNSARSCSISSRGVRSCRVTTKDLTSPPSERMGVALTRTATLRPSGTCSTISSARTVSPMLSARDSGNSWRETSRPSPRSMVSPSRSWSSDWSGFLSSSAMRSASRLKDSGAPVLASKTATPTGEVSIRVCKSLRARCSSRCRRALATTMAAWAANMVSVSSSSWLNSSPGSILARKKLPTRSPWWSTGAARKGTTGPTSTGGWRSSRSVDLMCSSRSGSLTGWGRLLRYSNSCIPSGNCRNSSASCSVMPEKWNSCKLPESSSRVTTP